MKKFSSEKQKNKNNLQHPKTQSNISSTFKEGQKYPLKELVNKIKVGFVGSCNKYYCDSKNGIPMIRTTNLTDNGVNLENIKYVTEDFFNKNPKSQLHKGNILIARHGNNGLASIWTHNFKAQCLNIVIIEPNEKIMNNYYLYYIFNSALVQRQIKAKVSGSVQGVINTKDISEILIPYYKLDHQKKVSNVLLTMDTKIALMEQKCNIIKKSKKVILQQLLPKNISEVESKTFSEKWNIKKLDEIAKIGDGVHQTPNYVDSGVKFISVEDIDDFSKSNKFIEKKEYDKYKMKTQKNDIFLTRIGTVGKSNILRENIDYAYYVSLSLIRSNKEINPNYLNQYIESNIFQRELWKRTLQNASPMKINLIDLKQCLVAFPSIKEQEEISNILNSIDEKIELLNKQIDLMKTYKKGLLQKMFI